MSFAKVVARILRDAPVTDPRAALAEIERAVKLRKASKAVERKLAKPVLAEVKVVERVIGGNPDGSTELGVLVSIDNKLATHQKILVLATVAKSASDLVNELKVGV